MTSKKNILITGARSISTLNLVRILSKAGHQVFVADTQLLHPTYFSSLVHKAFTYPSPKNSLLLFISTLEKIIKENKINFLIPTCEEIFYIAKFLPQLSKLCQVFCSPFEQMMRLHNKWSFFELQKKHQIPTPVSFLIHQTSDLNNPLLPDEYILKPVFSRSSQFVKKVQKNKAPPTLEYSPNNPWMAQKWIYGKHFCSYSICHQGDLTAHSCYGVRFTVDQHSCISFLHIEHLKIFEWVKKFVHLENYTGQIAFDFIETEEGDLFAIECNPRTTSGLHLFNEHKEIHEAFFEPDYPTIQPSIGVQRQLFIGMLLFGWKKHNWHLGRLNYFKELLLVRDTLFSWQDPLPYLTLPLMLGVYLSNAFRTKKSLVNSFTEDIEWNGEHTV